MSATSPATSAAPARTGEVDPRGQRFAAALTSVVLLVALVAAPSVLTTVLLVAQAAAFLAGVALGPARTPYAWVYRRLVLPRIGRPDELEPASRRASPRGWGWPSRWSRWPEWPWRRRR